MKPVKPNNSSGTIIEGKNDWKKILLGTIIGLIGAFILFLIFNWFWGNF